MCSKIFFLYSNKISWKKLSQSPSQDAPKKERPGFSRKLKSRQGSCQKGVHFKILSIIPLTLLQRSSFPVWVFPSTEGNHLYMYIYIYLQLLDLLSPCRDPTPHPQPAISHRPGIRDLSPRQNHPGILGLQIILLMEEILLVVYPIIYKVLYIPGGTGFLPSTAAWIFLFPAQVLCETAVCLQVNTAIILKLTNNTTSKPHAWGKKQSLSFFLGSFPA